MHIIIVVLYKADETTEFEKIFGVLERFIIEGDEYVENTGIIGFIENLQNVAGNNELDPEVFYKYLKPLSVKLWNKVNLFWEDPDSYLKQIKDEKS